jgi:hypothetical protein
VVQLVRICQSAEVQGDIGVHSPGLKILTSLLFRYSPTLLFAWIAASLNLLFQKLNWTCLQKSTPMRQRDLEFSLKAFIAAKLLMVRSMFERLLKSVRYRIQNRFNSEAPNMINRFIRLASQGSAFDCLHTVNRGYKFSK